MEVGRFLNMIQLKEFRLAIVYDEDLKPTLYWSNDLLNDPDKLGVMGIIFYTEGGVVKQIKYMVKKEAGKKELAFSEEKIEGDNLDLILELNRYEKQEGESVLKRFDLLTLKDLGVDK